VSGSPPTGASGSAPPTVLRRILDETREDLERRKRELAPEALKARAEQLAAPLAPGARARFHEALARPGIGVIAEFKRRSPSAGRLREDAPLEQLLDAYERGGASALSILTEGPNFGGSLGDLSAARAACSLPILRKDFVVEEYQLHEALVAGADAVLLIVGALSEDDLARLHQRAAALGLDVLVEVHDEQELACAAGIGARLIGVNNRDLRDFSVDVERTHRLLARMPAEATVVSESGISTAEQLHSLEGEGVSAVLVGETLMRAPDPSLSLAELLSR
jgi:indole-3-glycerol phosphate synthase